MNTKKIPFSPPDVGATEAQEVTQALLSGWITTGPRTKEFERKSQHIAIRRKPSV